MSKRSRARQAEDLSLPFSSAAAATRSCSAARTTPTSRSRAHFSGSCCLLTAAPSAKTAASAANLPARSTAIRCSTACRLSTRTARTSSRAKFRTPRPSISLPRSLPPRIRSFRFLPAGRRTCGRRSEPSTIRQTGTKQNKSKLLSAFDRPAPWTIRAKSPRSARETAALAAYTACVRPGLLLAYHTQGRVIYPGGAALDPPGSAAIAAKLSAASGYEVQNVPPESSNAGYKDWFLARFHRPGFTIEAGTLAKIRWNCPNCRSCCWKTNRCSPQPFLYDARKTPPENLAGCVFRYQPAAS